MICHICKSEISDKDHSHIYRCNKDKTKSKKEVKLSQISFNIGFEITYEWIYSEYIEKKKTLPELKSEYGLPYKQTLFILDFFNIPIRSHKESCNLIKTKEKRIETILDKYGVENCSQSDVIKERKKNTFLKNYGVDNIWKSPEYYCWLHKHMINKYGKKSVPNRYGKMNDYWDNISEEGKKLHMIPANEGYKLWWENLSDDEKTFIIQKRSKSWTPSYTSKLENRVSYIFDMMSIEYTRQKFVKRKSFDFLLNGTNCLIEVNGNFWHANPKHYSSDDLLNFNGGTLAQDVWDYDAEKNSLALQYGYHVIYLWEDDITSLTDDDLMIFIYESLKNAYSENKIYKKNSTRCEV